MSRRRQGRDLVGHRYGGQRRIVINVSLSTRTSKETKEMDRKERQSNVTRNTHTHTKRKEKKDAGIFVEIVLFPPGLCDWSNLLPNTQDPLWQSPPVFHSSALYSDIILLAQALKTRSRERPRLDYFFSLSFVFFSTMFFPSFFCVCVYLFQSHFMQQGLGWHSVNESATNPTVSRVWITYNPTPLVCSSQRNRKGFT